MIPVIISYEIPNKYFYPCLYNPSACKATFRNFSYLTLFRGLNVLFLLINFKRSLILLFRNVRFYRVFFKNPTKVHYSMEFWECLQYFKKFAEKLHIFYCLKISGFINGFIIFYGLT